MSISKRTPSLGCFNDSNGTLKLNQEPLFKWMKKNTNFIINIKRFNEGLVSTILDLLCPVDYWIKDKDVSVCNGCNNPFKISFRKHHCRCCGGIFCKDCCNYNLELNIEDIEDQNFVIDEINSKFKCTFLIKYSSFMMRICSDCFTSELDAKINAFHHKNHIKSIFKEKNYHESFITSRSPERKTNRTFYYDKICKEMCDVLIKVIKEDTKKDYINRELLETFIEELFEEFEVLKKYKIDLSAFNLRNLIEVVRLPGPSLDIEFFPGIILNLNQISTFKQIHKVRFPYFLIIKKNYLDYQTTSENKKQEFHYVNINEFEERNKNNLDEITKLLERDNINVVFSEYSLPTKAYFMMKRKGVDMILPMSRDKLELIEKLAKSSLQEFTKKDKKETDLVQYLGFSGEYQIKREVMFENQVEPFMFIQKSNPEKHSFNTFSIIVRGPLDYLSKSLKKNIKKLLPYFFQKNIELKIIENEMQYLDKRLYMEFSLSINPLNNVDNAFEEKSLHDFGNFIYKKDDLLKLIQQHDKLVYYVAKNVVMNSSNAYKEFKEFLEQIETNYEEFMEHINDNGYEMTEFNSMTCLYNHEDYSYMAGINLSKTSKMLKMCDSPLNISTSIYGSKDTSLLKVISEIFHHSDVKCSECTIKNSKHYRFYYINNCCIKFQCHKIRSIDKNKIIFKQVKRSYINFQKKDNFKNKSSTFKHKKEEFDPELRTGILCADCNCLISKIFYFNDMYKFFSFSLFLYFFSLNFNKNINDDANLNKSYEKITQSYGNTSNCLHKNLTRIFLKDRILLSIRKYPLNKYRLLTNNEFSIRFVATKEKTEVLERMRNNLNLMINYALLLLNNLETIFFEKYTHNIQILISTIDTLNGLIMNEEVILDSKSQKACNDCYLDYCKLLRTKMDVYENTLNTEFKIDEKTVRVKDIDALLPLISINNSEFLQAPQLKDTKSVFIESDNSNKSINNSSIQPLISQDTKCNQDNKQKKNAEIIKYITGLVNGEQNGIILSENSIMYYENNPASLYANYLNHKDRLKYLIRNDQERQEGLQDSHVSRYDSNLEVSDLIDLAKLNFELRTELEEQFLFSLNHKTKEGLSLLKKYFTQFKETKIKDLDKKIKIKEYYSSEFEDLRKKAKIGVEYYYSSLSETLSFKPSGGKTGATFYITNDKKYVIKEISGREMKNFLTFFPNYYSHIAESLTFSKPSFICLIFGAFKIRGKRYIVMENLQYFSDGTLKSYDIKGSELNRFVTKVTPKTTLPDTNFQIERNGEPLCFTADKIDNIYETMKRDTFFLSKNRLIDYSLLVIIDLDNKIAVMKIIDYLRGYDFIKNVESKWKTIKMRDMPTIISPEEYSERFMNTFQKYFIQLKN